MRVFLIQQKQLEDLSNKEKIKSVSIQRIDIKKWIPLFEVYMQGDSTEIVSLRVQSREEVRSWADLRLLAEWLKTEFGVERCTLLLNEMNVDAGAQDGKT